MGNSLGRVSNPRFPGLEGHPSTGVRKVSYRGSLIARTNGPSGRVPQGFVRRVRRDPGDRLRAVVHAPPRATLPPVDGGVRDLPRPGPLVANRDGDRGGVVRRLGVARAKPRGPHLSVSRPAAVIECRKALNWKAVAGSTTSSSRTQAPLRGGADMRSECRPAWRRIT